jgi:hypothetical protein
MSYSNLLVPYSQVNECHDYTAHPEVFLPYLEKFDAL